MEEPILYQGALVTGASSGLGEEFARQLAPHCRRLVLVARRQDRLEQLAQELKSGDERLEVLPLAADLASQHDRGELFARLAGTEWAPDLLVNNAGMGDYGDFASADPAKVQAMIDLNISALTHLTHGFLPGMIQAGRGAILNVSSLAGELPMPDFAVYAASKAYVTSFSEALRAELSPRGIDVLAVCPGPVHTEFGARSLRPGEERQAPLREWFYVPREQVVRESLRALRFRRARVFPGWKVALFAAGLSLVPMTVLRCVLACGQRQESGTGS